MKKFFVILSVIILTLSPLSVSAESANYAAGLTWEKGLNSETISSGLQAEFRNISHSYSSGYLDILPAMKKALGNNDSVTVTLSAKIKAIFADTNTESFCRLLIRAHVNLKNYEEWGKNYAHTLNGDDPFFSSTSSNILRSISPNKIPLKENWTEFSVDITATRNHIYSSATPNWYFCVDSIDLTNPIGAIFIKDVVINIKEASQTSATPTPTPISKDEGPQATVAPSRPVSPINPPAVISTPSHTPSPTPSPTPSWQEQPIMKDMSEMVNTAVKVSMGIIVVMGIVYLGTKLWERKQK